MTQTNEVPGELSDDEIRSICIANGCTIGADSNIYGAVRAAIKASQERRSAGAEPVATAHFIGSDKGIGFGLTVEVEFADVDSIVEGRTDGDTLALYASPRSAGGGEAAWAPEYAERIRALADALLRGNPSMHSLREAALFLQDSYLDRAAPVGGDKVPPSEASEPIFTRIGYIHEGDRFIYKTRGKPSDKPVYIRGASPPAPPTAAEPTPEIDDMRRDDWRKCYSAIINSLAAMLNAPTPDKIFDLDAIPADPIKEQIVQIRLAVDKFGARPELAKRAAPSPAAPLEGRLP